MEAFRNLDIWKRACQLSADLYELTSNCRQSSFKGQVTQAGLSVASNIAEGYERDSVAARIQYLKIAKGSCGEVWRQLMMGWSAGLINPEDYAKLEMETSEISRMLWDAIRSLQVEQQEGITTRV